MACDLQRGLDILLTSRAEYAFSVTTYAFPIQRATYINQEMRIQMFNREYYFTRSQDLEEVWHDAGQCYWGKSSAWLPGQTIFSSDSAPVPVLRDRVQDIDTVEDWSGSEMMFEILDQSAKTNGVQN